MTQADQALQSSMMHAISGASAGDVIVLITSDGGFQVCPGWWGVKERALPGAS